MKTDKMIAFLGKDTVFEGKLAFYGMVRIDGVFKGTIAAVGTLIIGESGNIEGDVQSTHAVVSGEIHGNIFAGESIEIRSPGKVFGDICSPTVIIHDGVIFEGSCKTLKKEAADTPKSLPGPETPVEGGAADPGGVKRTAFFRRRVNA